MKKILFLSTLFILACQTQNFAQCLPNELKFRLEIDPDDDFQSYYWGIYDPETQEEFQGDFFISSQPKTFEFCLPDTACLIFYVYDESGDGFLGDGYIRVFINDTLFYDNPTGDFEFLISKRFACTPGAFCDSAFDGKLGAAVTPSGKETWFSFTPAETGTYQISTCHPDNACLSKIWVYNFCENLFVAGNQAGAIAFAETGCSNGALATAYLKGGEEYFIRMAYRYFDCSKSKPIHYSIDFKGPVVGCTDPTACNYNPLATVADTCIYSGAPCLRGPDLVTDENQLRKTIRLETQANGDNCAIEEGCLRGFGTRHLILFDTRISNIGNEDYFIGETPQSSSDTSSQFVWDQCHNHWHYRGYAEYLIYDNNGNEVPIGQKNGFCVLDLECYDGTFGKYTCENMGITAGCGDVYDNTLPCQWVDITDLAAGFYTLVMRVNWNQKPDKNGRGELRYDNNWAQACFELKYDSDGIPELDQVQDCPKYTDCDGKIFGNTKTDCEGKCGGATLQGDWDKNQQRNADDLQSYLTAALAKNSPTTTCNDLHEDGKIDVFDAALLQECNIHQNNQIHWGNRFPCAFPTGTDNPNDKVTLTLSAVDTLAKTVFVKIQNTGLRQLAFQLRMSGCEIESVESATTAFTPQIKFDAATGEIIGIATDEKFLKKNFTATNFLKIKYKKLTAQKICIAEITAFVNERYQRANSVIGTPSCSDILTATDEPQAWQPFEASVVPNPFQKRAQVFFENPSADEFSAWLTDARGRVVERFSGLRGESFLIENPSLAAGVYLLTLQSERGRRTLRVVVF